MRNRIMITIMALLTWVVGNAHAANISIDNVTLNAGATKTIPITLPEMSVGVAGFQFDIEIPDKLELVAADNGELFSLDAYLSENFTVTFRKQSEGCYRLMAYSPSVSMVPLNGMQSVMVKLKANKKAIPGTVTFRVKNIVLSDADGVATKLPDVSSSITIAEPVKVTAHDKSCVYGDSYGELTYEISSCYTSGTPVISCAATKTSRVGSYDIVVSKGTLETDTVTLANGTLTITKASLVIKAGNYTKREGDPMPEFKLSYEGFKNNETNAVLIKQPVVTCSASLESGPGEYAVTVSGATAQNYDISYVNGVLIVTERPSYTLTYLVDGTVYKTFSIKECAVITPEAEPTKEGYTFSGWSEIPATMPAHDVTVSGSFTVNKYKLTYVVDGVTFKTYELDFGATITPEPAPMKEGHTFSGWSEIPSTMPAHDVTIKGSFTVNKYQLTYVVDGETYKTYEVEYGAAITPEPAPTKEGYSFSGWNNLPATMPAHDVTTKGTFTVNKYKLTYIVDSHTYKTYDVEYGTVITPELAPTKEGYTFSGWSEIPATMPAHDVIVTGTFTVNKYKLTYVVDGQTYKTYDVEFGTAITPEPAPTKDGYTFSGWSEIPATMPAYDVTVTGSFSKGSYKLIYMVDGETYKTIGYNFGDVITPEPEPTRVGYTFSGWSEIPTTMPSHDVTVTGTFTVNKYKLTYVVDGQTYKSYEMEYGASITPEAEPIKEGYTFSGWSDIPATMPAYDVTVTGTFTKGSYKLIYIVDGEVYKTIGYDYGDVITPEPEPNRVGCTFSGWSEIPATMPAHDVTVTGTFTVNKYKLTYVVDGQSYKSYEMEYGVAIIPEAEPIKEGYTFSGWSDIPATMPAHDVTITGSFIVNKYKLTYVIDGQTYKSYEVEYGATINTEPVPSKEGHTFSGWNNIPATMPAHDVTVTGSFTVNKYKLTYVVDGQTYKSYEVDFGTTITPEPAPSKEGYTFSGWSEIPATMPAHDVTVTGSFTKGSYKLTYMVDGEVYKTFGYDFGDIITPEPEPTRVGYVFSGWSEIPATMPAHDVTVTGSFAKGIYKLIYMVDGEEYKMYELEYGAIITPEAEPTKDGYNFSGWSEIPNTMPAYDVTVTGTFSINKYKLTYIVDGEEYKTYEVEYGTIVIPEAEPTKEGYTFGGWSEIPETMPAHDVTVNGTFSINSYTLTYMIGDEVYKQVVYEYGATIMPEPQPEGDYKTFEWVGVPETMPAHDVTVTAVYETGIADIMMMAQQGHVHIYAPNGKMLDELQKGLNIVVMQDGTTWKVVVK